MAIAKFEELTKTQQGLLNDLANEFKKVNPKPTNGVNRFSFNTMQECIKEEARFKETIKRYNLKMIDLMTKQLKSEIKAFEKEFGEAIKIQMGYSYPIKESKHHTIEKMLAVNKVASLNKNTGAETHFFFVSKTKRYKGDQNFDYCGGYSYTKVFLDFKREAVSINLENGNKVVLNKIIGLQYNTNEWYRRDEGVSFSSLDELIQLHKPLQITLVELAK